MTWLIPLAFDAALLLASIMSCRRLFLSYRRAVRASGEARRRLETLPPGQEGFLDVFADDRELAEAAQEVQKFPRGYPDPTGPLRRQLTTSRARIYAAAAADRADYLTYVGQIIVLFGGSLLGWTVTVVVQDLPQFGFRSLLVLVGLVPGMIGILTILRASRVWQPLADHYEAAGDRLERIERDKSDPRKRRHRILTTGPDRASFDRITRQRRKQR